MKMDEVPPSDLALYPCNLCERKFQHESLIKHANICQKTNNKKRSVFDSYKQRRQGTDLAQFSSSKLSLLEKSSFLEKEITSAISKMSLKKSCSQNDTSKKLLFTPESFKCHHCGGDFGGQVFDFHIVWCAERARLANAPGAKEVSIARSRLIARTSYKPPPVLTKRLLTGGKTSANKTSYVNLKVSDGPFNREENRRAIDGPQRFTAVIKSLQSNLAEPLIKQKLDHID